MRISHNRITRSTLAVGIVLAGCTAQGAGPSSSAVPPHASASPSASAKVEWTSFSSDRYAYTLEHPADWVVRETPGDVYIGGLRPGTPGTDLFIPPESARHGTDDGVVVVMAHDTLPDETLEEFTRRLSLGAACGSLGRARDPMTLGGEPAEVRTFACGGHDWLQLTALRDGRGYVLWAVATTHPRPTNRPVNDAIIASFAFASTAEPTASDPAAWVSFTSERYGYAIDHPADMEVLQEPGVVEFPGLRSRKPGTDTIATPESHEVDGHHHVVTIAVRDLDAGETLGNVTARATLATPCAALDPASTELDGEPADLRRFFCGSVHWRQITAIHAGRAYVIWLSSILPPERDPESPMDDMLESFRFTD